MTVRDIPEFHYDSETHKKILCSATELFATKGFGSVSMKDIARAVGIKTSSIYYYYEGGKDALIDDILSRVEEDYRQYMRWLSAANLKAKSLEELMDNMFNEEFLEMRNPIGFLGMSLMIREQHSHELARKHVFEMFYDYSIASMQAGFDRLIKMGVIPRSDTKTLATLFMFCVMVGCDIRIHEYMGNKSPIDCIGMYSSLRKHLTDMLTH